MSVAEFAARFDPQLTLNLASCDTPVTASHLPSLSQTPPTHADLAAAAFENTCVRTFIGERVATWSDERVARNPPCRLVYEHGEVAGSVDDLPAMIRHAEKRPGMGRLLGLRALQPEDDVLPYNIGLWRAPSHPRRRRYEQRMALRNRLSRGDRPAVRQAMRRNLGGFLAWAASVQGLEFRVADSTGLSLNAFWRAVRGRTL